MARHVRNFVWHQGGRDGGAAPFTPTDAVLAEDNRLYVTDHLNNRIRSSTATATRFTFGRQGYWQEGSPTATASCSR